MHRFTLDRVGRCFCLSVWFVLVSVILWHVIKANENEIL